MFQLCVVSKDERQNEDNEETETSTDEVQSSSSSSSKRKRGVPSTEYKRIKNFRWGRDFSHPSRSALGTIQPPVQWA
jgi:hypothetical protein